MALDEPRILERTYTVTKLEAIHFLGPQEPPVLSTPSLVNWMEMTSREIAGAFLNPGEDTVGVSMEVKHLAPTPVGMKVRVISKLKDIQKRTYVFEIEAYDEVEKIAEATHQRASIRVDKFAARIAAKGEKTAG
jgi:predicted thioesterase